MVNEQSPSSDEYTLAAQEFERQYSMRHPEYTGEEVRTVRENSGLGALVSGEDLPLGSLGLLSSEARRRRAQIVGERYGKTKDS